MDSQTELLQKILDVVTLIAEPQIAQRDEHLRNALLEIVGKGILKAKAVRLMDGTKLRATISREAGIDQGGLSRLTKALKEAELLGDEEMPKLKISLPPDFMVERKK